MAVTKKALVSKKAAPTTKSKSNKMVDTSKLASSKVVALRTRRA